LSKKIAYVSTQFGGTIKVVQCDREFNNVSSLAFFATNGVIIWMSCPYTSPQNDKVKCILHTINNIICFLPFQASISACYWVQGLHIITYLLNRLLSKAVSATSPYIALHGVPPPPPSYEHMRVFSCACYPNPSAETAHKLAPRSIKYVFLDIPLIIKVTDIFYLFTNNIVVFRHVIFNETDFLFFISPYLTNYLDIFL
jgi:hypothetical protein